MNPTTDTTIRPSDYVFSSHLLHILDYAVRNQFGVLDNVSRVAHYTWNQNFAIGELDVLPHLPLVLVTHVGSLNGIRSGLDLQHDVYHVSQRDVCCVGSMPATPTHVVANTILGNRLERDI